MQRISPPCQRFSRQRGISLLESLIALVISVLGIMGILGMQMRTLTDSQTATRRAQAIRLIEDLSERMRVHPNALANINSYVSDFDDEPDPDGCTDSPCTPEQLLTRDLGAWKQSVANTLPLGQANVFIAPWEGAAPSQVGVMVRWRENERSTDDAYLNTLDAISASGGATVACNSDKDTVRYTCHLQYISVAARCALSADDSRAYCPRSQQ